MFQLIINYTHQEKKKEEEDEETGQFLKMKHMSECVAVLEPIAVTCNWKLTQASILLQSRVLNELYLQKDSFSTL